MESKIGVVLLVRPIIFILTNENMGEISDIELEDGKYEHITKHKS